MINYYRRFVPGLAKSLAPLHELLKSNTELKKKAFPNTNVKKKASSNFVLKKKTSSNANLKNRACSVAWSQECESAFVASKAALSRAVLLHHPNPFSAVSLTVDALEVAVGAELA